MGLTILAFVAAPCLAFLCALCLRRAGGLAKPYAAAPRIAAAFCAVLALYCLDQGLAFVFAGPGFPTSSPLIMERLSASLMTDAQLLVLLFALYFPAPVRQALRAAAWAGAIALGLAAAYSALSSFDYMISVYRPWTTVFRIEGPRYGLFVWTDAALGALTFLVLCLRSALESDRVQKQRALVAASFVLAASASILVSTGLFEASDAKRPSFVLAPAGALLLATGLYYALSLARLFDRAAIGRALLGYGALLVAAGLPAGGAAAGLALLGRESSPLLPAIGAPIVFAAAALLGRRFIARFFQTIAFRGSYRERLQSELAAIDFAAGRDQVLAQTYACLARGLGLGRLRVLVEDEGEELRPVFPARKLEASLERAPSLQRGTELLEALEAIGSTVILRTEAQADPAYAQARGPLLELFAKLEAEAFVVALEGRRAIALFALGPRGTGAEYTAYDYESLRSVYGKLYVIAYYLKNVARERLTETVDREIALSDQVRRYALDNVDRIEHPLADAGWISRSPRGLGGEFIDSVRLSRDRWFLAMGDISGTGLSAAMSMLVLKSMIRTFLGVERDFVGLVSRVNDFIKDQLPRGSIFAGYFACLDLSKPAIYFVNCGIPAMILRSPGLDDFIEVKGEGRILGFVRDIGPLVKVRRMELRPGSMVIATTDGIVDCENLRGERFGEEGLRRAALKHLALPASIVASAIADEALAFSGGPQEDELSVFALKIGEGRRG